jgi:hypothetical protein
MTKQSRITRALAAVAVCAFALTGQRAGAQTWIDWTAVTSTGALGIINLPSGPVDVTYTGNLFAAQLDNSGVNHWTPATSWGAPGIVAPTNSGIIELRVASVNNTLTFSQPLNDLFFAVFSVGTPNLAVHYSFNSPFAIVAQGPSAEYPCGPPCGLTQSGMVLTGVEGNGTLRFNGPVSSLSFDVNPDENFHGFTLGSTAIATPEPASMTLLATGLVGVFGAAVRRRKARDL